VIVGVSVKVDSGGGVFVCVGVSLGAGVSETVGEGVAVHSGGRVAMEEVLLGVGVDEAGGRVKIAITTSVGGRYCSGTRPGTAKTAPTHASVRQLNSRNITVSTLNGLTPARLG
jgi:hypothetical protein